MQVNNQEGSFLMSSSSSNIAHELQNGNGNSSKIDNLVDISSPAFINREIYFSPELRSIDDVETRKKELKSLAKTPNEARVNPASFKPYHQLKHYKEESLTVNQLADLLRSGYSFIGATFQHGLGRDHIKNVYWIVLDFDSTPVEKTLSGTWSNCACMWYYTPSYEPGVNWKHRLVFRLDKPVTGEEAYKIYTVLLCQFYPEIDAGAAKPEQMFFGARDESSVSVLDDTATLEADVFITFWDSLTPSQKRGRDKQQDKAALPEVGEAGGTSEGVRSHVLRWANKEIWVKQCNSDDVDTLYALHPHNFENQGSDRKNIAKWGGHRPEDTSKDHGTGFFVYWADANFPPRFTNQVEGLEGTFIDYWHHYGNSLWNKNFGSIVWQDDQNYENYQAVCDDIARWFKVEPFDFDRARAELKERREAKKKEKTANLIDAVHAVLNQFVIKIKKGAKDNYLYFDFLAGVWRVKPSEINVLTDCVSYALKNIYEMEAGELSSPKISSYICSLIKYYDGYHSVEDKLEFDKMRNRDVIPMANGDYNWRTGVFSEGYDPQIYNMVRSKIPFQSIPPASPSKGVLFLNHWLDEMSYTPLQRQAITAWIIVNCLGIATKTKRMFCVYGTPNTGKTVIGQIIQHCLGSLAYTARGNQLTDTSNRFANQSLDGIFSLFIDEFKTDMKGWELLKQLTGNANITIEVEQKGMTPYNANFYAGITTATQDKFYIPNSDDGGIRRRVVLLKHTKEMFNPALVDVDEDFGKPEIYQDIFNWAIQQDADKAVSDFIAYAKSDEAKSILREVLETNDKTLMFMKDCIEFTSDEKQIATLDEIFAKYEFWIKEEMGEEAKISRIELMRRIVEKVKIEDNKISWLFCPKGDPKNKKIKMDIGGGVKKQVNAYEGIVFKNMEETEKSDTSF